MMPARSRLLVPYSLRGGLVIVAAGSTWRVLKGRRVVFEARTYDAALSFAVSIEPPPRKQQRRSRAAA